MKRLLTTLLLAIVSAQPLLALDCTSLASSPLAVAMAGHTTHPAVGHMSYDREAGDQGPEIPFSQAPSSCILHSVCGTSTASISPVLGEVPGLGHQAIMTPAVQLPDPDLSQDPPPPRSLR